MISNACLQRWYQITEWNNYTAKEQGKEKDERPAGTKPQKNEDSLPDLERTIREHRFV